MRLKMLMDTHAHLDFAAFDPDREEVIARAQEAGVTAIVNPGAGLAESRKENGKWRMEDGERSIFHLPSSPLLLTPDPYRGQRNEPAYVRFVAQAIAELQSRPFEEVARATTANARRVFGLPEE